MLGQDIFQATRNEDGEQRYLETLDGTNNLVWVTYEDEQETTFISLKANHLILHESEGRNPLK